MEECGIIYLHPRRTSHPVLVERCKHVLKSDFKRWRPEHSKFEELTDAGAAHYVAETEFFVLQELVR